MKLCDILICLGVLVTLGIVIWVLVKQHDCCKKEKHTVIKTPGVYFGEEKLYFNPHEEEFTGLPMDSLIEHSPDLTHLGWPRNEKFGCCM